MRLNFLATLVLAPALLHAQAYQQQNAGTLEARAVAPAALSSASSPAAASAAPTNKTYQVSTGVVEPQIVKQAPVVLDGLKLDWEHPQDNKVVLALAIDEKGTVQNLTVLKSYNKALDERVVEAVRKYEFKPATLDKQPIPVSLELSVVVQQ
jgi:TonB family protein